MSLRTQSHLQELRVSVAGDSLSFLHFTAYIKLINFINCCDSFICVMYDKENMVIIV